MRLEKTLQCLEVLPIHRLEFDTTTTLVLVDDPAIDGHGKDILIACEQGEHTVALLLPAVHVFQECPTQADVLRLGVARLTVIEDELP